MTGGRLASQHEKYDAFKNSPPRVRPRRDVPERSPCANVWLKRRGIAETRLVNRCPSCSSALCVSDGDTGSTFWPMNPNIFEAIKFAN
jgi:hypothetical protein